MASSNCKSIWKKDSNFARVQIIEDEKAEAAENVTIINEGYVLKPTVIEQGIGIINLRCSGKLCVKKDDPLCRGVFVVNPDPEDASDKLIMYKLDAAKEQRDKVQRQIILLESQLKQCHFLHWTMPGPSVTFQEIKRWDLDGPHIDIDNDSDQKFVWMVPIIQEGSDQFTLQPYDQVYYLKCRSTTDANTDTAIVVSSDEPDLYEVEHNT